MTRGCSPPSPTRGSTSSATAPDGCHRPRAEPESEFDAEAVFAACREHGVAVEINSRPERPRPAACACSAGRSTLGCMFSIDTDAHAPGQLDWQAIGCARAEQCGITADRVINTWPADELLAWARDRRK